MDSGGFSFKWVGLLGRGNFSGGRSGSGEHLITMDSVLVLAGKILKVHVPF